MSRLDRLARQLAARECDQAVVRLPGGKLGLMPADSPRFAAMLNAPAWAARVVGVFSPAINAAELARQVSA